MGNNGIYVHRDQYENYLAHASNDGWTWDNHKYIDRIWNNGAWKYIYNTAQKARVKGSIAVNNAKATARGAVNALTGSNNVSGIKGTTGAATRYNTAYNKVTSAKAAVKDVIDHPQAKAKIAVNNTKAAIRGGVNALTGGNNVNGIVATKGAVEVYSNAYKAISNAKTRAEAYAIAAKAMAESGVTKSKELMSSYYQKVSNKINSAKNWVRRLVHVRARTTAQRDQEKGESRTIKEKMNNASTSGPTYQI